jgi:hypothetical protein
MERIRNSWELGKISWSVLKSDRRLAWFPVLSAIASLIVVGIIGGLIAATGVDEREGREGLKAIGYVFVFIGYVGLAFVTTYFLGALVHAANERLSGRDSGFGEAIAATNAKLHRILPWAFVQATVSVIIQAIEDRAGWLGVFVARLLGAAWAVLTFLVVPIIMLEDLGPIDALKRSGSLLKKTWGENLAAQIGFGLLGFLVMLPGIALVAIGVGSGSTGVAIVLGAVGVAWLVVVAVVLSAMSGIYRTALYRFVVDGTAPAAFEGADLRGSIGPRQERRGGFGF